MTIAGFEIFGKMSLGGGGQFDPPPCRTSVNFLKCENDFEQIKFAKLFAMVQKEHNKYM